MAKKKKAASIQCEKPVAGIADNAGLLLLAALHPVQKSVNLRPRPARAYFNPCHFGDIAPGDLMLLDSTNSFQV